jgi:hypothetical protein
MFNSGGRGGPAIHSTDRPRLNARDAHSQVPCQTQGADLGDAESADWHDRSHRFGPHGPDTPSCKERLLFFQEIRNSPRRALHLIQRWVSAANYLAPRAGFRTGASSRKCSKRKSLGNSQSTRGATAGEQRLAAPDDQRSDREPTPSNQMARDRVEHPRLVLGVFQAYFEPGVERQAVPGAPAYRQVPGIAGGRSVSSSWRGPSRGMGCRVARLPVNHAGEHIPRAWSPA